MAGGTLTATTLDLQAGTLTVQGPFFAPVLGQTFDVLTFASRTGDFATINGLNLGGGLALSPLFDPAGAPTRLRLHVVTA